MEGNKETHRSVGFFIWILLWKENKKGPRFPLGPFLFWIPGDDSPKTVTSDKWRVAGAKKPGTEGARARA